jgi:TonB-dependent Receptor Plug Domain
MCSPHSARRRAVHARFRALILAPVFAMLGTVAATAQDTSGVAVVRGAVVDAGGGVAICVATTGQCDVTGPDGRFEIAGVRAGRYPLEVIATGTPAFLTQEIEVRAGLDVVVDVALPDTVAVAETVTVTSPTFTFPEEVRNSGYLVSPIEILSSAGALQDVSRYVQTLPGVAIATADFRNDLIVRGGSPLENLYIVDNVEIPNLNAFATFASAGGTVSMLDAAPVQNVTFLTGGYPAAYGNRTSSVMQITQRDGSRTRLSARGTFGYAGAGAIVEGPLGRRGTGSWIVSARRSLLDVFTDDVGIGGVPVLYTLNAKAVYDVSPRDRLWLVSVGGVDEVRLGLTEESDLEDELSNLDVRYEGSRSATGVNWQRLLGTRSVGLLGITYSRAAVNQRVNDLLRGGVPPPGTPVEDQLAAGELVFRESSTESEATIKYDLTTYLRPFGKLQGGGAIKRQRVRYDVASPFGTDGPYFPVADVNPFALDEQTTSYQTAAYLQGTERSRTVSASPLAADWITTSTSIRSGSARASPSITI